MNAPRFVVNPRCAVDQQGGAVDLMSVSIRARLVWTRPAFRGMHLRSRIDPYKQNGWPSNQCATRSSDESQVEIELGLVPHRARS
jgi:hypothetical protein